MASKLPSQSLFDSPLRSTSEVKPTKAVAKTKAPVAKTKKVSKPPSATETLDTEAIKPKRKSTIYLSDDHWDALNEEVYLLRKSGLTGREANITKVMETAIEEWVQRRKTS